jgi:hypothetical protein
MTVSRAIAAIVAAGCLAACTSSGNGGPSGSVQPTGSPSGSGPATCTKSAAKAATTVVISGKSITPSCVKLARGKPLSIVNGSGNAVHGTLSAPSKKKTTVDLPHKNSVYPFKTKKAGEYAFTCKGCSEELRIFVS